MSTPLFNRIEQIQLLKLARSSVKYGLSHHTAISIDVTDYNPHLQEPGAAFVTLEKHEQLRGCIGSVDAIQPLVENIVQNAWNAAFRDPRFGPVTQLEFPLLQFEISILTKAQPMQFSSEENLKQQIIAGKDGLILQDGYRRGLFLPAVWEKLPEVETFLSHLKQKAGLSANYWSETLQIERFYSFEFGDD